MREVKGKGVSIRKDTTYNYKSDHFEFMLCEKIIERGSALGKDMLTLLVAEIQKSTFLLFSSSSTSTSSSKVVGQPADQQSCQQFLA